MKSRGMKSTLVINTVMLLGIPPVIPSNIHPGMLSGFFSLKLKGRNTYKDSH